MSGSDIWAPDSDSDCDYDSRSRRICEMESQYTSGRNLFIMSASIKGELENNPWARKRKRSTAREKLDDYYGAVKPVQSSQSGKSSKIESKLPAKSRIGPSIEPQPDSELIDSVLATKTPLWDRNSARPVVSKASKPIARMIDFQQFDSQAPAVLLPKRRKNEEAIEEICHNAGQAELEYNRRPSPPSTPASRSVALIDSLPLENDGELQHRSNNLVEPDETCQVLERPQCGGSHSTSPVQVDGTVIKDAEKVLSTEGERELQELPSVIRSTDADNATSKSPSIVRHIADQEQTYRTVVSGDETLPTFIINTQAELASAKRGLIGALQLNATTPVTDSRSDATDNPILLVRHGSSDPRSHAIISQDADQNELGFDIITRIPLSSPLDASSARATLKATTPPQTVSSAVPCFAQFRSPVATQSSFLAFGSPLTFSPERPARSRQDQTINDIHRYLSESAFDLDDEAKRMLDQS